MLRRVKKEETEREAQLSFLFIFVIEEAGFFHPASERIAVTIFSSINVPLNIAVIRVCGCEGLVIHVDASYVADNR